MLKISACGVSTSRRPVYLLSVDCRCFSFDDVCMQCLCLNEFLTVAWRKQRLPEAKVKPYDQNNAARIVLQAPRRSDVNSLLQTLHWLPVEQRIKLSWPCWRSRLSRRHLRSIWASKSRCAPSHATLDRHPSYCCACHFDGHRLPDDRSALPHLWLGTHCHLPY